MHQPRTGGEISGHPLASRSLRGRLTAVLTVAAALAHTARRRLPLTTGIAIVVIVVGVATGALWAPLENRPLGADVGYGLPSLHAGHWWTLLTGAFFAAQPIAYVPLLLALFVLGGIAEWRLGTRRVLIAGLAAHLVGVGGALSLLALTAGRGWEWSSGLANHTDLGLTTAVLGAAAAASATLSPAWRLRLRVLLVGYVGLSLAIDGDLADVEHALGVAVGLAIGHSLASASSIRPGRLATHADRRLLAAVVLVAAASVHLLVASQRWSLLIQDTGSVASRAETVGALRYGGVLLVPLLLIAAAVCVWRGGRVGWWAAIALLVGVTASRLLPMRTLAVHGLLWWPMAVLTTVLDLAVAAAVIGLVAGRRDRDRDDRQASRADVEAERDLVRGRLRRLGSTNRLAWMTTWAENRWFHADGVDGHLAYRSHARVALGLCDPVASHQGDRELVLRQFADRAHQLGMIPCVFAASRGTMATADRMGWRSLQIAEEAVVDLPDLQFRGKAWQDVRTALNQGTRRGITVVMGRLEEQPPDVRHQVAEISRGWTAGKRLPELGFTLGGLVEAADPEVRIAVAVDRQNLVHGVTSWLPAHRPGDEVVVGWTLDVMRRRSDETGFRGVMELLIASSLLAFRDQGCAWASLSASPLAHVKGAAPGTAALDTVLQRLSAQLEPFYGFRSLHEFKAKFQPRFEPLYLVYPDDLALPRISVALTRAYLPRARVRDLVALGQHQLGRSRGTARSGAARPVCTDLDTGRHGRGARPASSVPAGAQPHDYR